MNVVPKLPDLLYDHAKAALVPSEAIPAMLGELERLKATLWARLTVPSGNGQPCSQDGDRLLSVEQAAEKLGISKHAIYRKAKAGNYDFVVRSGRTMKFSDQGVERYIRLRMGK